MGEGHFALTIKQAKAKDISEVSYKAVSIAKGSKATVDVSSENPKLVMKIDYDGDGKHDKFLEPVRTVPGLEIAGLPLWIWIAIGILVVLIVSFLVRRRMARK
jgi:hypothetical protein